MLLVAEHKVIVLHSEDILVDVLSDTQRLHRCDLYVVNLVIVCRSVLAYTFYKNLIHCHNSGWIVINFLKLNPLAVIVFVFLLFKLIDKELLSNLAHFFVILSIQCHHKVL